MLLASFAAAYQPRLGSLPHAARTPLRTTRPRALYEDDPWLLDAVSSPTSPVSLETLFMYGPVVWSSRCFNKGEYNASVRKIMDRYPKISRALAEQQVNEYLFSPTDFLASQTDERQRDGPQESELKPPTALADKLLVVAWVAILVPAVAFLVQATMDATGDLSTDPVGDARFDFLDAMEAVPPQ
tara:strand:- start:11 stop:565 length:555 start_codon:yes stop_codon:yes gene_type:complete